MSKRPEPVMACAECGPVIREYVGRCPLCANPDVFWVDLAAGLDHEAALAAAAGLRIEPRLNRDAANLIRAQQDTIESMQQAQGGAKERRQGLKAARLATVIQDWIGSTSDLPIVPAGLVDMPDFLWAEITKRANKRYGARHTAPSDETKRLVAAKFAEPQEAPDAL